MKRILLSTAVIFAVSGAAYADTTLGSAAMRTVTAHDNAQAVADTRPGGNAGRAAARDDIPGLDERARAILRANHVEAVTERGSFEAFARVGNKRVRVKGGEGSSEANNNLQFQVGNRNQAVNMQVGNGQESATLQVGNRNMGLISQTDRDNEAAIAQKGDRNMSTVIQDGRDNGAASAQDGNRNASAILQMGDHNIAANAQKGERNNAMVFQNDGDNTAANVQIGNDNGSLISQGGGANNSLTAVDGTVGSVGIGQLAALSVSGASAGNASNNAAASLQLGHNNQSAIIQQGNRNEAINYQNSR
jgi:hypothetical protein